MPRTRSISWTTLTTLALALTLVPTAMASTVALKLASTTAQATEEGPRARHAVVGPLRDAAGRAFTLICNGEQGHSIRLGAHGSRKALDSCGTSSAVALPGGGVLASTGYQLLRLAPGRPAAPVFPGRAAEETVLSGRPGSGAVWVDEDPEQYDADFNDIADDGLTATWIDPGGRAGESVLLRDDATDGGEVDPVAGVGPDGTAAACASASSGEDSVATIRCAVRRPGRSWQLRDVMRGLGDGGGVTALAAVHPQPDGSLILIGEVDSEQLVAVRESRAGRQVVQRLGERLAWTEPTESALLADGSLLVAWASAQTGDDDDSPVTEARTAVIGPDGTLRQQRPLPLGRHGALRGGDGHVLRVAAGPNGTRAIGFVDGHGAVRVARATAGGRWPATPARVAPSLPPDQALDGVVVAADGRVWTGLTVATRRDGILVSSSSFAVPT